MNEGPKVADEQSLDILLDIYLDGRLVRSVALDAAVLAQAQSADGVAADAGPDRRHLVVAAAVARAGRLRLDLDLRRRHAEDGGGLPAGPLVTTFVYDTTGRGPAVLASRT